MGFRFRLTFHHRTPGFFRFDDHSKTFSLTDDIEVTLVACDADTLSEAKHFHFEARGFPDEKNARAAGERLRLRLRVLNSLLDLGITVPTVDTTSAHVSDTIKRKLLQENGSVLLDSIVGLAVFPDDDNFFEFVVAGNLDVHSSGPSYLFGALKQFWPIEMQFDERTEDALEILGRATTETSLRARFLLIYLAAERMVDRAARSDAAKSLISEFQKRVRSAGLDEQEADSLCGALAQLNEQSFSNALAALADRITDPPQIHGKPLRKFLADCVAARNRIAHNAALEAALEAETNLQELADGLRHFVMTLIWTANRIPPVSIDVPPSTVSIPAKGISIRIR
jgi:hypothetical protein